MLGSLSCGGYVDQVYTAGDVVLLKIANFDSTAVSSFIACPVRIRFKTMGEATNADVTIDEDNLDISGLGRRTIPGSGTPLMSVTPDKDTYTRVEMDLEDSCGASSSLTITNTHGTFTSVDRITLVFTGSFVFDVSGEFLNLDIDNMITELKDVATDTDVSIEAQVATGVF